MLINDENAMKRIVAQLMDCAERIRVTVHSEQEVHALIANLRYERTILFHLGEMKYTFYPHKREVILYPEYLYSKQEYQSFVSQLASVVDKIRNNVGTEHTQLQRELRIHDLLCEKIVYVDDGIQSHSILGPLLYRRGVCDGISKTAKVLFQVLGIEAHVIDGIAHAEMNAQNEAHAWNVICIDNNWYHLDITFDNTLSQNSIRYDYFNLSSSEIIKDHVIANNTVFAKTKCTDMLDYYARNGLFFDTQEAIYAYLRKCIQNKMCDIQIRVSDLVSRFKVIELFEKCIKETKCNVSYQESYNSVRNILAWNIDYHK